ncbi:MAG: TIR domain-containing protein [Lacunisphaera sp.]|nr:TIR domain-containing protein [Lacunisphaera sp.]
MNEPGPSAAPGAVFLSYASQDTDAAQRICDALRARGVEVWFDRTELEGGDAWDAKIKRQIRHCALFIPLISENSQSRKEGYFRREWNLATHRLLDMAPGTPFLLPVVLDETTESAAFVAEEFLRVQWSRLPGGATTPAFVERVFQLLAAHAAPSRAPFPLRSSSAPGLPAAPAATRRWGWPLAAALTCGVLAGWLALSQGWLHLDRIPETKQLVILPFKNIGASPANEAFSDGLSETITAQLTQLEQFQHTLLVVPMSEVRKESIGTASQARSVFGATLALSGSVQHEAGIVRVTVSLVDTRSLRILRSATLDHPMDEVYRLQDRVAAQTAEWLGLALSPEARRVLATGQTTVAPAYALYLQGLGELVRTGNTDAAIVHLQQALVSDPRYALAHAALGEAFWQKYTETKSRLWIDEARRSCNAALEFGAALAAPHVTLAVILNGTGQYEPAAAEAQTALRLDSASTDATRALARALERLNRPAEAEAALQRILDRYPANGLAHMALATFYWRAGRNAEAESHFLRVTELMPDNYAAYRNLGGLYVMMGRSERAAELLEKSIALKPTAAAYSNLGTLRFQQQRYADSATLFEQASQLSPHDHLLLGNLADALRYLPARANEAAPVYARAIGLADEALAVNVKDAAARASIARYCAFSGAADRARKEIAQASALAPANLPILLNAAVVFERLGERDRAVEALTAALKGGYPLADVNQNPDLAALRADPRLAPLLAAPAKTGER